MKELMSHTGGCLIVLVVLHKSVFRVSDNGVPYGRKMGTNLMGLSGYEMYLQHCETVTAL